MTKYTTLSSKPTHFQSVDSVSGSIYDTMKCVKLSKKELRKIAYDQIVYHSDQLKLWLKKLQ